MNLAEVTNRVLDNKEDKAACVAILADFLAQLPDGKLISPKMPARPSVIVEGKPVATYGIEAAQVGDFALRMHLKVFPRGTATVLIRKDGSRGVVNFK